ncbi:uncharacterized protein LOC129731304 isoform X2 [Wyeomyia smithii]|nr:uncharacterized protein LOC129731304 isoform X2 [Wyeomyia smithii]
MEVTALDKQKKTTTPSDNPYAREIFMSKTNVEEIVQALTKENSKSQLWDAHKRHKKEKGYRERLYRFYAEEPKLRVRDPLYKLQFRSSYYQYRFFLALKKPLYSEAEYKTYLMQLQAAGMRECMVNMRKNNIVLKLEDKIIPQVRSKFPRCWSGKLEKLSLYVMDAYQRKKEKAKKRMLMDATDSIIPQNDHVVNDFLKCSNASDIGSARQINSIIPYIDFHLEHYKAFGWLEFNNNNLNKQYKMRESGETSATVTVPVPMESPGISNSSDTMNSLNSEMEHMRAEMAMTQPTSELLLPGSCFTDTIDVINALSTTERDSVNVAATVTVETQMPDDKTKRVQSAIAITSSGAVPMAQENSNLQIEITDSTDQTKKSSNIQNTSSAKTSKQPTKTISSNIRTTLTRFDQQKSPPPTIAKASSTPSFHGVVPKPRKISYESDSQNEINSSMTHGLNSIPGSMPNTEKFCPPVCSTQISEQQQQQNESSHFLITPAQPEVYEIPDSPSSPANESIVQNTSSKTANSYTLEYMRNYSNIDQLVIEKIKGADSNLAEKRLLMLDKYVERFYKRARGFLSINIFPEGLKLLTSEERIEKNKSANLKQVPSVIATEKCISCISNSPPVQLVSDKANAAIPCVTQNSSLISETIPNTEDFCPPICSTQLPEPLEHPTSLFNSNLHHSTSQNLQLQTVQVSTSRRSVESSPQNITHLTETSMQLIPTPSTHHSSIPFAQNQHLRNKPDSASESSDSNITVLHNSKKAHDVTIKQENNISDYGSDVEFQEMVNNVICLSDDDDESNHVDANELIDRHSKQPGHEPMILPIIRDQIQELFTGNLDKTLSQNSSNSGVDARSEVQSTSSPNNGSVCAECLGFR